MTAILSPDAHLFSLLGASGGGAELHIFDLCMGILGGLALFLYGMDLMAFALKAIAGDRMKALLARLTSNRFMGVCTGTLVTAVIQSSSVTTVLVVGFISAGLMSLTPSIGVILGAGVGTTITAQIIAFKVTHYALVLVALGFAMLFFGRKERWRYQGKAVMGLGLVFFGMYLMSQAVAPLRENQPFIDWMARMENPILGIVAGAIFTAIVQSSSASVGVVIVLASQGLISLTAGIALVFGANIGTCITALLAAAGRPREAMRAAVAHVLFKVLGVLLWIFFLPQLEILVRLVSPAHGELAGSARLAAEAPRQIANAHSIFNLVNVALFLPFATQFARLIHWFLPDHPQEPNGLARVKYIDPALLETPSLALDHARLEILHMGNRVKEMLVDILPAALKGTRESLARVEKMDDGVDSLHGQIITFLGKVSQEQLNSAQTQELLRLIETTNDLENIGDVIETNLVGLGFSRLDNGVVVSPSTHELIGEFHSLVLKALETALVAVTQKNEQAARMVTAMKRQINSLSNSAVSYQAQRLVAHEPNRLPTYSIETDLIENLKRIFYFAKRMARAVSAAAPLEESA